MIVIKSTASRPNLFNNKNVTSSDRKNISSNFEARIINTEESLVETSESPEKNITFLVEGHIEIDKSILVKNDIEKIDVFLYSDNPSDQQVKNKRSYTSKTKSNKISRRTSKNLRSFNKDMLNHEVSSRKKTIEKNKGDKFNRKVTSINIKQILNFEVANKKRDKKQSELFGNNSVFVVETQKNSQSQNFDLKFGKKNKYFSSPLVLKKSNSPELKDFNDPNSLDLDLNSNLNKKVSNSFLRLPGLKSLKLSSGLSRSEADIISGRFKNKSISSYDIKNPEDYSQIAYDEFLKESFSNPQNNFVIKKEKKSNVFNVVKFEFEITESDLKKFEASIENYFIFKAYNKKGDLFDSFFQEYDISQLRRYNNFVDMSNFDFSVRRNRNIVTLSATNNSNHAVTLKIFKKSINFQNREIENSFEIFKEATLNKKSSISLNSVENSNDEIEFRIIPVFSSLELNNSTFLRIKSENKKIKFYDKNCKFSVLNKTGFMSFYLFSCSDDIKFARVVKRNLTKKQKQFELAKTISSESDSEREDVNFLFEHMGFVVSDSRSRKNDANFIFNDYDVEDENVYEYKLLLTLKNGETVYSNQSFVEKYEKPSGEVLIEGDIRKLSLNSTPSASDSKKASGGLFSISVNLTLTTRTNKKIQEFFSSLSRNAYESLKSQIDEIKEAINKNYLLTLEMSSTKTGETYVLGDYFLNEDNQLILNSIEIPSADFGDESSSLDFESYVFKVTPKVVNYYEYIDAINRNVEKLALNDRFKNNSDFDFLRHKNKLNKSNLNVKSESYNKFANKKTKLKGVLPPDNSSNLNANQEVISLDAKSTGDFFYKIVKNNTAKKEIEATFEKFEEFPRSFEEKNKRSLDRSGILKFSISGNNALANLDFLALHSFSRNKFNFHGKLFHNAFGDVIFDDTSVSLRSFVEMKNFVGNYVFFVVPFYIDGSIGRPISIQMFKVDSYSLETV